MKHALYTLAALWLYDGSTPALAQDDSAWTIQRSIDPINDAPVFLATLEEMELGQTARTRRSIGFYCCGRQLAAYIEWNTLLSLPSRTDRQEIILRFDSRQAEAQDWYLSTDYRTTRSPNAVVLLREIETHKTLAARATLYDGTTATAIFDISESWRAVNHLKPACKLSALSPDSEHVRQSRDALLDVLENAMENEFEQRE